MLVAEDVAFPAALSPKSLFHCKSGTSFPFSPPCETQGRPILLLSIPYSSFPAREFRIVFALQSSACQGRSHPAFLWRDQWLNRSWGVKRSFLTTYCISDMGSPRSSSSRASLVSSDISSYGSISSLILTFHVFWIEHVDDDHLHSRTSPSELSTLLVFFRWKRRTHDLAEPVHAELKIK